MDPSSLDMLSGILWRERDVLARVVELARSDVEATDLSLRSLSSLELHRAILVREVAAEHSVAGEPSLPDLIQGVTPEWAAVLAGHRRALHGLVSQVDGALAGMELPNGFDGAQPDLGTRAVRTRLAVQRSLLDFLAC